MNGLYVMVSWPESQDWMSGVYDEDGIEYGADECTVFVPVELYNEVNGIES